MKISEGRKPVSREVIMLRARKAAETKLARRVILTCQNQHCGKQWREKPSHSDQKYCSTKCMGYGKRKIANFPCPDCGKEMIRRPHLSKTRCPKCINKWRSEHFSASGHNPQKFETPESRDRRLSSLRSDESRKRISGMFKGKLQTGRASKFQTRHPKAVECFLRSPAGSIHHCHNIAKFVSENKRLFDPLDTIQKSHGGKTTPSYVCNATQGISQIQRGHRGSWKGWTVAVSGVDVVDSVVI